MADLPTTLADQVKDLAKEYIKNSVETIRSGMGGHASNAMKMNDAQELEAWMRSTATPEQVADMVANGADDEAILQKARRYRHALGKAAGRGDPVRETEYHEKQAARAGAYQQALAAGVPHDEAIKQAMSAEPPPRIDPHAMPTETPMDGGA